MLHTLNSKLIIVIGLIGFVLLMGIFYFLYTPIQKSDLTINEMGKVVGLSEDGRILYLSSLDESSDHGGSNGIEGSDLIVKDPKSGESRVIAKEIWTAHISPDGNSIVTADSNNKVRLYSFDGTMGAQIGNNGASPIFTHDGKYIAYHKLADEGDSFFKLAENAKGIALYEILSGAERMLTSHNGDYLPIGFSADNKYFYFNAERPYEPSILGEGITNITSGLYSLDVATGIVTRLTNADERVVQEHGQTMSFISQNALWTSDRITAISSAGSYGTYKFSFDGEGGLVNVERISSGEAPRWTVRDKSFETRTVVNGTESWEIIEIN